MLAGENQRLNPGLEGGPDQSEDLTTGHFLQPGSASRMQQDSRNAVHLHGDQVHGSRTTTTANEGIAIAPNCCCTVCVQAHCLLSDQALYNKRLRDQCGALSALNHCNRAYC